MKVWPNPAKDRIFFEMFGREGQTVEFSLFSAQGIPVIMNTTCINGVGGIDISGIAPGFYILQVRSHEIVNVRKVLIVR